LKRILIVRPSSLGDIAHAMPVVHDLHAHVRGCVVDWVVEEAFAPLVALNRGVSRSIVLALRRWRRAPLARGTWREALLFRRELRRDAYDVVLDFQEQVKGAAIAWLARGSAHGPDRASIREPAATLFYRHAYRVDPRAHLIDRCRELAAKALRYTPAPKPRFDLVAPAHAAVASRYVVFVHATSRADKLWPEDRWRALIAHFNAAGHRVVLPWGNEAEAERSRRLAHDVDALVPARQALGDVAALLAHADLVCGVDTGLVHLAAALGAPTIALFVATDPSLAGVARASTMARDLGDAGRAPRVDEVIECAAALMRSAPRSLTRS